MTSLVGRLRHAPARGALAFLLLLVRGAAAQSGDALCDATQSTADTCVIVGAWHLGDDTVLQFGRPNVRLRGTVDFAPHCVGSATPCTTDADCAPAACGRTGDLALTVAGRFQVERGAELSARGFAVAGDTVGAAGGTLAIAAHELEIAGLVTVASSGRPGVAAGPAGEIAVAVPGTITVTSTGRMDASSASGGCGGTIGIGTGPALPVTLEIGGVVTAEGATQGGSITFAATERVAVAGSLQASNSSGDLRNRPPCDELRGGGRVRIEAATIALTGTVRARGKEAPGGSVTLRASDEVLIDSTFGSAAISVNGGAVDAFFAAGVVHVEATAGNVLLRHGAVEANGQSSGFGSDAGAFTILATGAGTCEGSGEPCTDDAACGPGGVCFERGGDIAVDVPLSAAGGAGQGSGCVACEVRGTGNVAIVGTVDVGGGRQVSAVGGKLFAAAGGDLTVGPGAVKADAGDGGAIILLAGERVGIGRGLTGTLTIANGTQVRADAFLSDGFGGDLDVEGCAVVVEPNVRMSVDGGGRGTSGILQLTAHERLTIGALAELSAFPDGTFGLASRLEPAIDPDASFEPPIAPPGADPSIIACPICGNGFVVPPEECDGSGSCLVSTQVCVPPGAPAECTCVDSCGTVPGIQPGEDCDGSDLGTATCESLGFLPGTLACHDDCTFDTGGCGGPVCGDGILGAGEACDPGGIGGSAPAFGDATCETLGFPDGGELACTADCAAIVTLPHCADTVEEVCTSVADCPAGEACVPGCVQCGNSVVDPGEECDDGTRNGSANYCRTDCRLPRCGDEVLDFAHCSGDREQPCSGPDECPSGQTCVAGERCDQGTALCVGGDNDGEPCCVEGDCPGGDCPGDECGSNRDDVAGCCRCDCTSLACNGDPDCDDLDFCTADACVERACVHDGVAGCCRLDVDGNGSAGAATDVVYVARRLFGLPPVPPSFRVSDPTIPGDGLITERIDGVLGSFDVDQRDGVGTATDVVYIARRRFGLPPVPPSFRVADPTIPGDAEIAARIDALCP